MFSCASYGPSNQPIQLVSQNITIRTDDKKTSDKKFKPTESKNKFIYEMFQIVHISFTTDQSNQFLKTNHLY